LPLFLPESEAMVIMAIGAGKEMDTAVTVITAVTILVDILCQVGTVIIVIIIDSSSVRHQPATVGTALFHYG